MTRFLALALTLVAALALTACGGGDKKSSSSGDESDSGTLKFTTCLREHGVNIGNPTGGNGVPRFDPSQLNTARFQTALQACRKYAPNGGKSPSAAQQSQFRDRFLKFAQCMRSHGVNVPDLQGSGPAAIQKIASKVNFNSPAFKQASQQCRNLLPTGGPGAGAPAP